MSRELRIRVMTQIEQARSGAVTPEMEAVARAEQLDAELVRREVAEGRMVIPANKVHLAKGLQPIGIGMAARTKINANIGKSASPATPSASWRSCCWRCATGPTR